MCSSIEIHSVRLRFCPRKTIRLNNKVIKENGRTAAGETLLFKSALCCSQTYFSFIINVTLMSYQITQCKHKEMQPVKFTA